MQSILLDLKQILRRLAHSPLFTAITLITLAIGIGGNTAIFSVLEGVLLKPLPYPQPDELVGVWHTAPGLIAGDVNMAPSNYFIYREQNKTFQDIGLYQGDSVSVTGTAEPEQVPALDITDGVIPILGVSPLLGRAFNKADMTPGSPDTVILTYGYWRRKFGGAASVIGRTIVVDGKSRQIIGVMPQKFQFLDWEERAMLLPLQFDRNKTTLGEFSYEGVARLKPGVTLAQANADISHLVPVVWESFPSPPGFSVDLFKKARLEPNIRPLMHDVIGDVGKLLWILMGSTGLVLLIACANVANLLLVRTEGRQQELAIRGALGASWGRIAREILLESLVLAFLGSIFGLALAYGALRFLVAMAPAGLPRLHGIGVDMPVLLFTLVVSLFAGLLFGAIPVFKYASTRLNTGLRETGRGLSQSRERHRATNTLVAVQVALAFVLLICSGLMIRTFRALTHVNPGFSQPAQVQTLRLFIPESDVPGDENTVRLQQSILQRLQAIPGVTAAGYGNSVPMDGQTWTDPVYAQDRSYAEGQMPPLRRFKFISPGLLQTLGIPLIAGRDFTWSETYSRLPVGIVSENFAREFWGSPENALGKRIRVSTTDDWREIVGVTADIRDDGTNKPAPKIAFWPIYVNHFESDFFHIRRSVQFAIRTPRAGSQSLLTDIRQAIWSLDPNLPLADVHTLDYYYTRSMARTSFTLIMLAIAGGMALLLGTVGLYGVIAYSVSRRTREIGIRAALGAQRGALTGMFLRQGFLLTLVGVAFGLIAALLVMRLMSSLLFGVKTSDPLTYLCVSIGLIATALFASYLPSRRAASIDPVEALRAE
ncbi:MAG TPA: ABC transporter permease [Candidatus Acidoferrum sp.]|nr:ABC transporter permease [Candidatus Acidoferrum sp.]